MLFRSSKSNRMFAFGFMLLMMGTHFQDDEIVELNEPTGKKITYTQTNNINDEKPKNRKKNRRTKKEQKKIYRIKQ